MTATISATFSEMMSSSSVVEGSVQIAPTVDGAVTYAGATVTLTPRAPLAYATTYTVTITTAAKDAAGNSLTANHVWSFTTLEAPPSVSSTDPASVSGVSVNAVIKATFSKQMTASSITISTFSLAPAVAGTVSYAGTTATFTPASRLAFATTYTATITTGVKDLNGVAMPANYVWSFTTEAQPAAPVASAGSDQDVNRSSNVTLDGSGSSAISGRPLTYTWTQVLGPDVTGGTGTLSGAHPVFAAPNAVGTLQFDLVVNDTIANSLPDRVQINVMKDATKAIFVAVTGQDSNAGTRALPMKTIQAAVNKAKPLADVYVAAGQYAETLVLFGTGVSIFGGFDAASGWVRAPANATVVAPLAPVAVLAVALPIPVELDLLTIRSAAATATGESSIGLTILNSPSVAVRGCTIQAGDGAAAAAGADGTVGAPGGPGGNGVTGGAGGAGNSSCGVGGGRGGAAVTGGLDGNSGFSGSSVAGGGQAGAGGTGATGHGQCGIAGTHGNDAPNNATPGVGGANGLNGTQGALLGSFDVASGGRYLPPDANAGTAGRAGGGGGGGGSGSGDSSLCGFQCCNASSGGGGGGGAGGCGGPQGAGGGGGGGSFAIVSLSSTVTVDGSQLSAGRGGNGGKGGNGGAGGQPGSNGAGGATGGQTAGNGAPGKPGGAGGTGGSGAGGTGGPSICVAFHGTVPARATTTCFRAGGGAGGAGGANGTLGSAPSGPAGASFDAFSF